MRTVRASAADTHGAASIDVPLAKSAAEAALMRKIAWKLLPILGLGFMIAYLDRSNIGIASLTMMPALGMNSAQFGLAAGLFFIGYVAAELPSNLLQVRIGARRWLARIMITWGIIAMGMAFVVGHSFYAMRVLLGIAEAGFTPGAVLYLGFWFPERYRSRIFSLFLIAIPASVVVGAPISSALLYMDGIVGVAGWQWLFLVEGLPAVLIGLVCLRVLPDGPEDAAWLDDAERQMLRDILGADPVAAGHAGRGPIVNALLHPKMWLTALYGTGIAAGSYGIIFFMPQIIAESGTTHLETGLLTALPFIAGAVAMALWGWHADRTGERRWHAVLPLIGGAAALASAGLLDGAVPKLAALIVAAMCIYMSAGLLWTFPALFFRRGAEAAAAIAIINMLGMLAGFFQPIVMGSLRLSSGHFSGGLFFTACVTLAGAVGGVFLLSGAAARVRAPD